MREPLIASSIGFASRITSPLGLICLLLLSQLTPAAKGTPEEAIECFWEYLRINTAQPDPDYASAVKFLQTQAESIGELSSKVVEFVQGRPLLILTWNGTRPSLPSLHGTVLAQAFHPFCSTLTWMWWGWRKRNGNTILSKHSWGRTATSMEGGLRKSVTMQYLEAIRNLKNAGFRPVRTIHLSIVPDEETGGEAGFVSFVKSEEFLSLNVGVSLDEGLASEEGSYRLFNSERSPWWLTIKSSGRSGHGSRLYDNSALENFFKSIDIITSFRASQFDLWKAGIATEGEVISVNPVYLRAGTLTPTGYVSNVQPSEAEAGFDIRVPPLADTASLQRRISEEWAPASRNMSFEVSSEFVRAPSKSLFQAFGQHPLCAAQFIEKVLNPVPELAVTAMDESNPWWMLFNKAIVDAGGVVDKAEILPASTDSRLIRRLKIPAFGFSPIAKTPILLHEDNEFLNAEVHLKGVLVYEKILRAFSTYTTSLSGEGVPEGITLN